MTTAIDTTPRIYVACLASYNAGILYGAWIDATQDEDEIQDAVTAMLEASPEPGAEEWAIHDYENFGGIELGEWEDFANVSQIANGIEEHGEAYTAWVELLGSGEDTDPDRFEDQFQGEWDSMEDYAQNWLEDTGGLERVPEDLRGYFDYRAYARDMFMNLSSERNSHGTLYVFNLEA